MAGRPVPRVPLSRARGVSLPKVDSTSGFGEAGARRVGGPQGFRLLFALQGVLGSGEAFPVLGKCSRHLPAAVGRSLPPWFALSGRRALGSSAPEPHLWPPFASPRQAFSLDPLGPPASLPTAGISPRPPQFGYFQMGNPSLRALYPSPFSRAASATLWVATASSPPLASPPPPFLPSPLQSSSHCLPPPPPLSPGRPPPPPLPRRGLKEPMGRRRQVSPTCTTWGRGKGRAGRATSQNRKAFSHCARLPRVQPCSRLFA